VRSKEQFKAYVYEKAALTGNLQRKKRMILIRSVAAFSLCVMVTCVGVYAGFFRDRSLSNAPTALNDCAERAGSSVLYGHVEEESMLEVANAGDGSDDAYLYKCSPIAEEAPQAACVQYSATLDTASSKDISYAIAESITDYTGEQTGIDFSKYVALVFQNCTAESSVVEYTDTEIFVTLVLNKTKQTSGSTYTVLLEKSQYFGKKITVICQ